MPRRPSRQVALGGAGVLAFAGIISGCAASPGPNAGTPSTAPVVSTSSTAAPAAPSTERPTASPQSAAFFARPFEYRIPDASDLVLASASRGMLAFTTDGGDTYGRDTIGNPVPGARGVTIAAAQGAVTHACGGSSRVGVREAPLSFIDDLRALGGIGLGVPTPVAFDGRSAWSVAVDPEAGRCEAADFHTMGSQGPATGYVRLSIPSRLTVADVDGRTVVLQAWAATEEELAAWLPDAAEFMSSVHFTTEH